MIIALALFWSWFVESFIEYLKQYSKWFDKKSWWLALVFGLLIAWATNLQVVNYLTATLGDGSYAIPFWADWIATGIAIGRGSNFVNSVLEYFYGLKKRVEK